MQATRHPCTCSIWPPTLWKCSAVAGWGCSLHGWMALHMYRSAREEVWFSTPNGANLSNPGFYTPEMMALSATLCPCQGAGSRNQPGTVWGMLKVNDVNDPSSTAPDISSPSPAEMNADEICCERGAAGLPSPLTAVHVWAHVSVWLWYLTADWRSSASGQILRLYPWAQKSFVSSAHIKTPPVLRVRS